MPFPRVVITGLGIISPFGRGRDAACLALRDGRSGIKRIESIDTSGLNCKIAGEVPNDAHHGLFKGFDRFSRFALIAVEEAKDNPKAPAVVDPERLGSILGPELSGVEATDDAYRRVYNEGK